MSTDIVNRLGKLKKFGCSNYAPIIYGSFSAVFLLLSSPDVLHQLFPHLKDADWVNALIYWQSIFFFLLFGACLFIYWRVRPLSVLARTVLSLCLIFSGLVMIAGVIHGLALGSLSSFYSVNVQGVPVNEWLLVNSRFTLWHLSFPVMLFAQIIFLSKLKLQVAIRILAGIFLVSLVAIYYQSLVDQSWLTTSFWQRGHRVGGLAYTPLTFAFCSFLLVALLIAGFRFEKNRVMMLFYIVVIALLVVACTLTGTRSTIAGIFLLALSIPTAIAISKRSWPRFKQLLVGGMPIALLLLTLLSAPLIIDHASEFGRSGERLEKTWYQVEDVGAANYLMNSVRGKFIGITLDLTGQAPLAGWGPGGFNREYSNVGYKQTGLIYPAFEGSPLNQYLWLAVDLGLPVLALAIIIVFGVPLLAARALRQEKDENMRFFIAILLLSQFIFLLMLLVMPVFPSMVWLWTATIAILLVTASQSVEINWQKAKHILIASGTLLGFITIFGSWQAAFGENGYDKRRMPDWWNNDQGYCSPTLIRDTTYWCNNAEIIRFPVNKERFKHLRGRKLQMDIQIKLPDLPFGEKAIVTITDPSGASHEITVRGFDWQSGLRLSLNRSDLSSNSWILGGKVHFVTLQIYVKRQFEISGGTKTVGVHIADAL